MFSPMLMGMAPNVQGKQGRQQLTEDQKRMEEFFRRIREQTDIDAQALNVMFTSINSGIDSMVSSWIDGTKSMDEVFKEFANNVIKEFASMILKALIWKALTGLIPGLSVGPTPGDAVDSGVPTGTGLNTSIRNPATINAGGGAVTLHVNAIDPRSFRESMARPDMQKALIDSLNKAVSRN
jgi:hypothetical protein